MVLHSLRFRTFCYATEDRDRVMTAFRTVAGEGEVEVIETEGFHGNPIAVISMEVKRNRDIKDLFLRFDEDSLRGIIDTLEERVDEGCDLYIRLDKQAAFLGRLGVVTHGDVISVSGRIESYPKDRDTAIANLREFLEGLLT